jgi:GNAT superfamily N-acetyltransferase
MTRLDIRSGRPEDAPFLAWAVLTASRGHLSSGWFDIALDRPERDCLTFLTQLTLTATESLWHYSRFLILEEDTCAVATLSAFRAAEVYPITPVAISQAVEALRLPSAERTLIWERGEYAFTCTKPPRPDCLMIENVATLPAYRNRGYSATLLERACESGRHQELVAAQVTFLIGNHVAERLYTKAGFRFDNEWCDPTFHAKAGSPGLRRLVRPLQEDHPHE